MSSGHQRFQATAALLLAAAIAGPAKAAGPVDNPLEPQTVPATPGPGAGTTAAAPATPEAGAVVGFGHDVPISAALHDVVPPGTTIRFAPGASPRTHVDWKGGAGWHRTVQDIAASAGLQAAIGGNGVVVSRPGHAALTTPGKTTPRTSARHGAATRRYARGGHAGAGQGVNRRFDSPTVDQMSREEADAATPAPVGAPLAGLPPPSASTAATAYGTPYRPRYAVTGAAGHDDLMSGEDGGAATAGAIGGYAPGHAGGGSTWHVADGSTLLGTLQAWTRQEGGGWTVFSRTAIQYTIHGSMTFTGSLPDATVSLVNAIHAPVQPYAHIHKASRNIVLTDAEHNSISLGDE